MYELQAIVNHDCMMEETKNVSLVQESQLCFSMMLRVEQQDRRAKMGK